MIWFASLLFVFNYKQLNKQNGDKMKKYSVTEIAKILGKSRQYVWLQIISKNLKAEKVGNYYSIKESDFKKFFQNDKRMEA